jgi:hypothetical protein
MTALEWVPLPDGTGELADGRDWTYLVTRDDRTAVLTRWDRQAGDWAVARQAALNAIMIGGAYDVVPAAAEAVSAHLRNAAQAYEAGTGTGSHPAWRHHRRRPASPSN